MYVKRQRKGEKKGCKKNTFLLKNLTVRAFGKKKERKEKGGKE